MIGIKDVVKEMLCLRRDEYFERSARFDLMNVLLFFGNLSVFYAVFHTLIPFYPTYLFDFIDTACGRRDQKTLAASFLLGIRATGMHLKESN